MKVDNILADRYQIRKQLSHKARRRTFLARDLQSEDLVIIKVLRFDPDFQWDDLKLFEREASTLKNLNHPAIPKYLDYFDVDEPDLRGFALVQTYIDARSLESVIKSGQKFSEVEVIELADRVLSILTYLHQQHPPVIHRDLKPSNILLGNRWQSLSERESGNSIGDVYLVDFGSVQTIASKEGGTITIVGSYGYIPLEQFGGQTTTASDLYSLGMTIIYLLTGTHPAELGQVNGRVKFKAEISKRFDRWLAQMTQPYLDKRFDSARMAQTALAAKDDGSYGDFIHIKPDGSQVRLTRDRDRLKLILHTEFSSKIIKAIDLFCSMVLISAIGLGILAWLAYSIFQVRMIALIAILFMPPLYISGLVTYWALIRPFLLLIQKLYLKYFQKYTAIVIEGHQFSEYRCSGTPDRAGRLPPILKRSTVAAIVYNPGYTFDRYLDADGRSTRRGEVKVSPELTLLLASERYIIGRDLSQAELGWLAQELSDFLDLELQIIYPTPQVPAVPLESPHFRGCGV
jgi:serine/threonine protein kinase